MQVHFSSREAAGVQTKYLEAPKISKKHYYIAFLILSSLDCITCIDKNKTQLLKFQELVLCLKPGHRKMAEDLQEINTNLDWKQEDKYETVKPK